MFSLRAIFTRLYLLVEPTLLYLTDRDFFIISHTLTFHRRHFILLYILLRYISSINTVSYVLCNFDCVIRS